MATGIAQKSGPSPTAISVKQGHTIALQTWILTLAYVLMRKSRTQGPVLSRLCLDKYRNLYLIFYLHVANEILRQLSMHLRGPMNVSQIAVYSLGSSISKRPKQRSALQKGYINEDEGELPGHAVVRESHANPSLTSPGQAEDLVLRWANESLAAPTSQTLAYSTPPNYNPTECGTTVTMTRTITSIATSCEMRCAPIEIQSTSAKPSKGLSPLPSVSHSSFIQSEAPCSCTTQIPTVTSFFPINVTIDVPSIDVPTRIQVSTPSTFVTIVKRSTQTLTSPQEVTATAAIWKRIAYYTSTAPPEATGFAFLANLGDDRKSGTFD